MKEKSIPCDVVLLPNEELSTIVVAASRQIAENFDVFSVLDNETTYAHASLYMTQLKINRLPEITGQLESIAKNYSRVDLIATGYGGNLGYSDVEYPPEEFIALQESVIKAINPLRDGMRQKDIARMQESSGQALQNYKKYGYPNVGKLMRPHITFCRLTSMVSPDVLSVLGGWERFSGIFDRLGLFEMGDNGTCIRKLGEWELK